MPTEHDVRRIAMSLSNVIEAEPGFSFSVGGTGFAWPYPERIAEKRARVPRLDIYVVRVAGESDKQALLTGEPTKFFTTDHYNGYPAVMVRLDAVDDSELVELLTDAHDAAQQFKKRRRKPVRRTNPSLSAD